MNSKTKLLNILLKKDISDKYWEIPVLVKIPNIDILGEDAVVSVEEMKFVGSEDSWIFNANCFHLAAKYNPRGLHMLLCYWKTHEKSIETILHNGNLHPLHVAAAKVDDSRSTRYAFQEVFSYIYYKTLIQIFITKLAQCYYFYIILKITYLNSIQSKVP